MKTKTACVFAALAAPVASSGNISSSFYASAKRGLVYVPNSNFPGDDAVWVRPGSDLTWYYNYQMYPSSVYDGESSLEGGSLEFVPMLWGAPSSVKDTTFLDNVTAQITHGRNVTYVMAFNEPDGEHSTGGSNVDAADAATYWIKQIEPLRELGVAVGAPAVTGGSRGFAWLSNFTTACHGGCTFDFVPVHWYGSFHGLQSHLADVAALFPGVDLWLTEFALDHADLASTQLFFQDALRYLDANANVTRYSYFGSFRSFTSNVGPNAAMLDSWGRLTDIGSWYLGGNATGVVPNSTIVTPPVVAGTATATYTMPPLATALTSDAGVPSRVATICLVSIIYLLI